MDELVIAFESTTCAIRAEKLLAEAGLGPLVMPLPSAIRAGCGICLRVKPDARDAAKRCLQGMAVSWHIRHARAGGSEYREVEA